MEEQFISVDNASDEQVLTAARVLGVDEHASTRKWFYAAIDNGASTLVIRNWMKKRGYNLIEVETYMPAKG